MYRIRLYKNKTLSDPSGFLFILFLFCFASANIYFFGQYTLRIASSPRYMAKGEEHRLASLHLVRYLESIKIILKISFWAFIMGTVDPGHRY